MDGRAGRGAALIQKGAGDYARPGEVQAEEETMRQEGWEIPDVPLSRQANFQTLSEGERNLGVEKGWLRWPI